VGVVKKNQPVRDYYTNKFIDEINKFNKDDIIRQAKASR
jgi:hypothetical protein